MLAIIAVILGYFCVVSPYWDMSPDSCLYVLAGKALHETGRYEVNGNPVTVVPFVFSGMIAAVFMVFGESYFVLNVLMKVLVLLFLVATFFLLRQWKLSVAWSLVVTLLTASSIHLIEESARILPDIPYALWSVLAVLSFGSYMQKKSSASYYLAVGLIAVSYFTRTIGLTLIAAALVCLFAEFIRSEGQARRKSRNRLFTAVIIFVGLAVAWEARNVLSGRRCFHYFRAFLEKEPWIPVYATFGQIIMRTVKMFVPYKLMPFFAVLGNRTVQDVFLNVRWLGGLFFYGIVFCLFWAGVMYDIAKRNRFRGLYILFYLIIFGLMNMKGGTRYLVPILPFIFAYPVFFVKEMFQSKRILMKKHWFFKAAVAVGIALYMLPVPARFVGTIRSSHRPTFAESPILWRCNRDEQELALWLKKNTDASVACLSDKSLVHGTISERRFHTFPFTKKRNRILRTVRRLNIDYLLVDYKSSKVKRFLMPVIRRHEDVFEILIARKKAGLYKVNPDALVDHHTGL